MFLISRFTPAPVRLASLSTWAIVATRALRPAALVGSGLPGLPYTSLLQPRSSATVKVRSSPAHFVVRSSVASWIATGTRSSVSFASTSSTKPLPAAYANRVMDAVIASRIPRSQLIIQSFVPANLDVAAQRLPGVATSLLSLQAINEAFLEVAAAGGYDFISPEWPVSADYVRRAHAMRLDVAPFTLDAASEVRAARRARVDALITDDPLMAAGALGLRPARRPPSAGRR